MVTTTGLQTETEGTVWAALAAVHDPEIPPCSITDLGMVERVSVTPDSIEVDLLPTFAGCPALDVIREDVESALRPLAGSRDLSVRFVLSPPWTSDRITQAGRDAMRGYGLTPPVSGRVLIPVAALTTSRGAICPFCGGTETVLESGFGVTLCRSTHFCRSCRNPFEAFKPKSLA